MKTVWVVVNDGRERKDPIHSIWGREKEAYDACYELFKAVNPSSVMSRKAWGKGDVNDFVYECPGVLECPVLGSTK